MLCTLLCGARKPGGAIPAGAPPNREVAYTSPISLRVSAAMSVPDDPNKVPLRFDRDHASKVLRSHHDRSLHPAERPPSLADARHRPVRLSPDREQQDEKGRWFPAGVRCLRRSPRYSARCDDDSRPPRGRPLPVPKAVARQTQARRCRNRENAADLIP